MCECLCAPARRAGKTNLLDLTIILLRCIEILCRDSNDLMTSNEADLVDGLTHGYSRSRYQFKLGYSYLGKYMLVIVGPLRY